MTVGRLCIAATLAVLLSACVPRPVRAPLPPDQVAAAQARQLAREQALRADPEWSLEGRIAVSSGRNGGSGRIEWVQDGPRFDVSLSAPVTRQSWRLVGDGVAARLEGLEGGPRDGDDATALLRQSTGWEIPVAALADWIRGARALAAGTATVDYGADGRLSRLQQAGWTIDYRWPEAQEAAATGPELPVRLDARRDDASVRLIVDRRDPNG